MFLFLKEAILYYNIVFMYWCGVYTYILIIFFTISQTYQSTVHITFVQYIKRIKCRTGNPLTGFIANREGSDEMPHCAAFLPGSALFAKTKINLQKKENIFLW